VSIKKKLLLSFSVVIAATLGLGGYTIYSIWVMNGLVVRMYDNVVMASTFAQSASAKFLKLERVLREASPADIQRQQRQQPTIAKLEKDFLEDLEVVKERALDANSAKLVSEIKELYAGWRSSQVGSTAASSPAAGRAPDPSELIEVKLTGLTDMATDIGFEFRDSSKRLGRATLYVAYGLALAAILASASVFIVLVRQLVPPLRTLVTQLAALAAGEGDLTTRVAVNTRDEIGELARWFNTFLDKFREIISQVISTSNRITAAAEEMAVSSREMARGAEDQTAKTTEVASAIQEMAATVIEVSRSAEEVTRASRNAASVASTGRELVSDTVEGVRAIATRVKDSAGVIGELGERSTQIGAIIEVIDEIADQTNLLALNAAIEAARAGEQGRGFAVVADEVRRLAERTGKATKEIGEMIRAIQGKTSVVVAQMNDHTQEAEAGVEQAQRAGDSLGEIVLVVEQVLGQAERIAAATHEQSTVTDQVSSNMEAVATIARQTAGSASATTLATDDLAHLAQEMRRSLGRFKLRQEPV
jgi:methyl-accepting chemotaxis protein